MGEIKEYENFSDLETRGERALCWAIVERAILDSLGLGLAKVDCPKVKQKQARAWILDSKAKTSPEPFSFLWICNVLDTCPKRIRKIVLDQPKELLRFTTLTKGKQQKQSRGLDVADILSSISPDDDTYNFDYNSIIR